MTSNDDYPRRYEWEDYFEGHGIKMKRRFVELPNDAYWVYRAECEAADLSVQAQTAENTLAMMIEEILNDEEQATEAVDR